MTGVDLDAVRARYRTAADAYVDADAYGWDDTKLAALTLSWQDVPALHDQLKQLAPILDDLMNAAVEAANTGHPMPLRVGAALVDLDRLLEPTGRLRDALQRDRRRAGVPARLPEELDRHG